MEFPVDIDEPDYEEALQSIKAKCDSWNLPDEMNVSIAQIDRVLLAFAELYFD